MSESQDAGVIDIEWGLVNENLKSAPGEEAGICICLIVLFLTVH